MSLRVAEHADQIEREADDFVWVDRSEFWLQKIAPKSSQFVKRAGIAEPLVLTGHGVSLRINHGSLLVRNGFTHYPQDREEWRFFPGDWRLPSRIVLLDVDGGLSFDALTWLARHEIPLVQISWPGEVTNIVGNTTGISDPSGLKVQRAAQSDRLRLQISRALLQQKLRNSIDTLRYALPASDATKVAIEKLSDALARLNRRAPATVSRLMGIEGPMGFEYFKAWLSYPLKWKGIDRNPVPQDWHRVERRTSKLGNKSQRNRNATHPLNAMLNYGYAVLENQIRMNVVARGLDPTIGFLHGKSRGKPGLVLDLMEPLRPVVDRRVLEFMRQQTFAPGDFVLLDDGVCRLNPQLARNVVRAIDVSADIQKCVGRFVRSLD